MNWTPENWSEVGEKTVESANQINQILYRNTEKLAQRQISILSAQMERSSKLFEAAITADSPVALINAEIALFDELANEILANVKENMELVAETQRELSGIFGVELAEKPKKAPAKAKAAPKAEAVAEA